MSFICRYLSSSQSIFKVRLASVATSFIAGRASVFVLFVCFQTAEPYCARKLLLREICFHSSAAAIHQCLPDVSLC